MSFKFNYNIARNNAKANGRDANIVDITLMNGEAYVDHEALKLSTSHAAVFENGLSTITIFTHVRGEGQFKLYSNTDGKAVVDILSINEKKQLSSVPVIFSPTGDVKNLLPPVAEIQKGTSVTILKWKDYYKLDHLLIKVPKYDGMKTGQTIKVYWKGRAARFSSGLITVKSISDIYIAVPRHEYIDSMGSNVDIYYTVNGDNFQHLLYSKPLNLYIEKQSMELPAPNISNSNRQLFITYHNMSAHDRIVISLTCNEKVHQSDVIHLAHANKYVFNIPDSWVKGNHGKNAVINYSMSRDNSKLFFSFYTRVKL